MTRVFAYCRVSTTEQTTANQVHEIASAGFAVEAHRVIEEQISGACQATQRPGWQKLMERIERGDTLIVTKLDRLGRDMIDVLQSIEALKERGVRLHCLALPGVDLTSAAGRMTVNVLVAVAQFERDLIIERTNAGLERAKAAGIALGRKPSLTKSQQDAIREKLAAGQTVASVAREIGTSRQTVRRVAGLGESGSL